MISRESKENKTKKDHDKIFFKIDKPLRMFVGEVKGDVVQNISGSEGFKDGDKVVVIHSEDWLWFISELLMQEK